jgi:tetratricopeptide (TPR) repeat protein
MNSAIQGQIDIVTRQGLVTGSVSTPNVQFLTKKRFKLSCGGEVLANFLPDEVVSEDASELLIELKFGVVFDAVEKHPGEDVVLSVANGPENLVLASARAEEYAARFEGIDDDGRIYGWAVGPKDTLLPLEVLINGKRSCSMLADRFCRPMSIGDIHTFSGFSGRIPGPILNTALPSSTITLCELNSGKLLAEVPFQSLKTGKKTSLSPKSPVDVLDQPDFSAIYNPDLINKFIRRFGLEFFLETAYAYILERRSERDGFANLLTALKIGEQTPRSILLSMYRSDERKAKGGFLGPYIGEPGYPFAEADETETGGAQGSAHHSVTAPGIYSAADFSNLRALTEKRDFLEAEKEILEAQKEKLEAERREALVEIERLAEAKANTKAEIAGAAKSRSDGPRMLPHSVKWGAIEISWGDGAFRLRIVPKRADSRWLGLADEARDARNWEKAADLYCKVLDENPDNAPIWVQYGHALKESGRVAEAEIAYAKAITLDDLSADAHLQRGHALKLLGRKEDAAAEYVRAVALNPGGYSASFELHSLGWSEAEILAIRS